LRLEPGNDRRHGSKSPDLNRVMFQGCADANVARDGGYAPSPPRPACPRSVFAARRIGKDDGMALVAVLVSAAVMAILAFITSGGVK
jgi:hypothetical protein